MAGGKSQKKNSILWHMKLYEIQTSASVRFYCHMAAPIHWHIVMSVAALSLKQERWVVATEIITWPEKLKLFTLWRFTEKVGQRLSSDASLTPLDPSPGDPVPSCHQVVPLSGVRGSSWTPQERSCLSRPGPGAPHLAPSPGPSYSCDTGHDNGKAETLHPRDFRTKSLYPSHKSRVTKSVEQPFSLASKLRNDFRPPKLVLEKTI